MMIIRNLGLIPYSACHELQRNLQKALVEGSSEQVLIVCQHPQVITLGTSAKPENVLIKEDELSSKGINVYKTERGGDVTCHMPGQIVLYPILDLHLYKTDVAWYMRSLEEVIIRTLSMYGINGERICGKTGVWVKGQKIASIGVRISRWRTMHGLSLNVRDCISIFQYINPCGYSDIEVTEMQRLVKNNLDTGEVANNLIKSFVAVFNHPQTEEDISFEENHCQTPIKPA